MTRLVAHLLILFVLFTHSTMAMDVHIPQSKSDHGHSHIVDSIAEYDLNTRILGSDQEPCMDAGGHCSHHQVHTSGLVAVNSFSSVKNQPILFSWTKVSTLIQAQAPLLRPPKS